MNWRVWGYAVGLGVANAIIFKVFEAIVNEGSDYIWNGLLRTDDYRILVVPVAVILGIVFSWLLRKMKQPRVVEPETGIPLGTGGAARLRDIGTTLVVGASSLLSGASLGPEASLTESSSKLGLWAKDKLRIKKTTADALVFASIGALMVAFLGSLLLMLLPFLLIYQKAKRIPSATVMPIVLACGSAFATLWLLDRDTKGYGSIPVSPHTDPHDYVGAVVVAVCISVMAVVLARLIRRFNEYAKYVDGRMPWYFSAALFGLVVGVLYLLGGESVQFSGSEGSKLLLEDASQLGAWSLFALASIKLLVTAWSKAAGYRGGLFFPSIFAGLAIGLWVGSVFTGLEGPGVIIGAIAAIFMALGIPDTAKVARKEYVGAAAVAFLIIAALLPAVLIPLALCAMVAAAFGNKAFTKLISH